MKSPKMNLRVQFPNITEEMKSIAQTMEQTKPVLGKENKKQKASAKILEVLGAKYFGESKNGRKEEEEEERGSRVERYVCLGCFCVYYNIERHYLNK